MNHYYKMIPKVVGVDTGVDFLIAPRYEASCLKPGMQVSLEIFYKRDFLIQEKITLTVGREGQLSFEYNPGRTGEYIVLVYPPEVSWPDQTAIILRSAFFAVTEEMAALRPYKGDFHIHTARNEKGRGESPAFMAARSRELGLDYAAITEHRYYEASLEAIKTADECDFDILLFPGEEVNYARGLGHILSINADSGMVEKIKPYLRTGYAELSESLREMAGENLPAQGNLPGLRPEFYAYTGLVIAEIRKAGGFAIIAHPFWKSRGVFDMLCDTYERILNDGLYDAVELIGDTALEDNFLSIAKFQERIARGEKIPVVSNSDSHYAYDRTLGLMYTICFTDELERGKILKAITERKSVACIKPREGSAPGETLIFGSFALAEYAYFLEREFFPVHDDYCRTLGRLYRHELETGTGAQDAKAYLQGLIKQLYSEYWKTDQ